LTECTLGDIVENMIAQGKRRAAQDLGAMLRKAIRKSGLTRNRLSELSGVRYAPLWKFMADERVDVTLVTASKLLTALGLRVEFRPVRRRKTQKDE